MQTTNLKNMLITSVLLLAMVCTALGKIIYVNDNAGGADNGNSWGDAYTDLAYAIFAAGSGDQVWVRAGEYKPGSHYSDSFDLKTGVAVYGGFPDSGDPNMADRDWETNGTTLSGEIGAVDVLHVVYADSVGSTAILDGFTISGGDSLNGGGMYNEDSSATIRNCVFTDNTADDTGAGMYNDNSDVTVSGCTFITNTAYAVTLGEGAGMYNYQCNPKITACKFINNVAQGNGGGISNLFSHPTIINCIFIGNSADKGGGIYNSYSSPTITNGTFTTNSASTSSGGGGIHNYSSSSKPKISNCILWGNTASSYPEIRNENSANPTISHCDIAGCGGSSGWILSFGTDGGGNIDVNPLLVSSSDIHLQDGSLCINAGNNSAPSLPATDFEGNPRILNGTVDIGADEWGFEYILASAPHPSDGSSDVSIDSDLSWTAHADAVSHDIWLGTVNPPTILLAQECPNTTIDPGTLHYGTVYYWQVDEVTSSGTVAGTVWSFSTPPGPGSGTEEEPYQISTFVQLQFVSQIQDYWDMHFVVTDDIVIGPGVSCIPIGNASEHFDGVFDGNFHVIRGLRVTGTEYLGLFGIVGSYGLVENLGVEEAVIECTVGSAGILAGRNNYGKISNCYSTGAVNGGDNSQFLGGLVGDNDGTNSISYCYSTAAIAGANNSRFLGGLIGGNGGSIAHCYSTGSVSGGDSSYSLGGLIGDNASFGCDIDNCYSTGAVTGGNDCGNLGGLIGFHSNGGVNNDITISDCYATGAVISGDSADDVGGLVGSKNGPINNCYSVGKITVGTGPSNVGGLVGRNLMGGTSRCFWDTETSGTSTSSGGTGKSTADMKMTATFTGWDFANTWEILENQSYPYQVIEVGPGPSIVGDVDGDGKVDFKDIAVLAGHWLEGV